MCMLCGTTKSVIIFFFCVSLLCVCLLICCYVALLCLRGYGSVSLTSTTKQASKEGIWNSKNCVPSTAL